MAPLPNRLCKACAKLELDTMLAEESPEQDMGRLSKYGDPTCPFCKFIVTAVSRAGWDFVELCSPKDGKKVPRLFVQSRSPLTVKKHSRTEYPEPRLQLCLDQQPEGFKRGRPTIRDLDRDTTHFIIAELESLPRKGEERLLLRRSAGERVDASLAKSWLQECNKNHEHAKRTRNTTNSLFQHKDGFLLIDVIDEKLVRRNKPCEYVALSYIWGGVEPFRTTTKNIDRLCSASGSLSPSQLASLGEGEIPRTVLDAMEFTRQLGIRHAWVDTLCILQDDDNEKARLIGRMDDIYDNAAVTLIAGSGANSETGLLGVSPREGGLPIERTTIVDDYGDGDELTFNLAMCPPGLCEEVRRSAWNTRCWTYQEQCLSQRCLYFTPHEVFFNCSEMQRREAYALQQPKGKIYSDLQLRTGPPWWNRKLRKDLDPTPYRYMGELNASRLTIWDYQTAVQDYTRKNLTYQEDIFNAFQGIFNRFSVQEEEKLLIGQTQGIPARFLWQGMLWFPSHKARKRVALPDSPAWLTKYFASWSWASWVGSVEFVFAESLWLTRNISQAIIKGKPVHPAIPCWYYPDDSGKPHWSCIAWKAAGSAPPGSSEFHQAKAFFEDRIGLDTQGLLSQSSSLPSDNNLQEGHLGFFAAYTRNMNLETTRSGPTGQGHKLTIGEHAGEFRYDSTNEEEAVEELVLLVAAESITPVPYTASILLGLVTRDGISRRVGLGYIAHKKGSEPVGLQWEYKFFQVG